MLTGSLDLPELSEFVLSDELVPGGQILRIHRPAAINGSSAVDENPSPSRRPNANAEVGAPGLDIVLHKDSGLLANTAANEAFERAASFWESVFHDPITINLDAKLGTTDFDGHSFPSNVLGSTSSEYVGLSYSDVRARLIADASPDESIVQQLPNASGQLTFDRAPGITLTNVTDAGFPSDQTSAPNSLIEVTRANALALGFSGLTGSASSITSGVTRDAQLAFNSNFAFDYDSSNGVSGGHDFEAIAIHEIGHALGFVSSVDFVDYLVNTNQTAAADVRPNPMDLFRLAPNQGASFTTAPRLLNTGANVPVQVFHDGQFDVSPFSGVISGLGTGDI